NIGRPASQERTAVRRLHFGTTKGCFCHSLGLSPMHYPPSSSGKATYLPPTGVTQLHQSTSTAGYNPSVSLYAGTHVCSTATHHRHSGHCAARGHKKKHHKRPHHPGHLHYKLPRHIENQPF